MNHIVMKEEDFIKKLKAEGFERVYVWEDAPNTYHSSHTHSTETAHIIMKGAIDIILYEKTYRLKEGDRLDVPANKIHSARVGKEGCRYIIGE